jgi:hypothetical protein
MNLADIERMNTSLASVVAQMRRPHQQLADIARALEDSVRPHLDQIRMAADSMHKIREDHAPPVGFLAQHMNISKTLASQIADAMRPVRELSQSMHEAFRPIREMQLAYSRMLEACFKPMQEATLARQQILAEAMRPLRAAAQAQRDALVDVARPFRQATSLRQDVFREIVVPLNERLAAVAATLEHYRPDVRADGDTLILDGVSYTPEDISRIENDFLYRQDGVLGDITAQAVWDKTPPAVRWLIQAILAALIAMILQCMILGMPNKPLPQLQHERKAEVRHLLKQSLGHPPSQSISPFVNTERLLVHIDPSQRTRVVAVLSYPQEVTVIEYRQKKRWAHIEWHDSSGTPQTGWTLGRYLFRMPGYPTTQGTTRDEDQRAGAAPARVAWPPRNDHRHAH